MATRDFFYDSIDEDRQYGSDTMAQFASGIISEGYAPFVGDELEVIESSPPAMSVRVSLGVAWVDGRYFEVFSAPETLTIPAADGSNPRIDRVVVRNDFAQRETVLAVKQGSPATSPESPSLQRDSTIYEISLAQVFVATAETSIENDDITDERDDSTVCGIAEPRRVISTPSFVMPNASARWVVPGWVAGNTTSPPLASDLNQIIACPIFLEREMQFEHIGVRVTTAASGTMRLGIYQLNLDNRSGTLVVDAGTVDTGTTGNKQIIINEHLWPGRYLLAYVASNVNVHFAALDHETILSSPIYTEASSFTDDLTEDSLWLRRTSDWGNSPATALPATATFTTSVRFASFFPRLRRAAL